MNFTYAQPRTLAELLAQKDAQTHLLAGGTDLLVDTRSGKKSVARVLDIKAIPELRGIRAVKGGLQIGACETFTHLLRSPHLQKYPALRECASVMGCHEIRNRATLGGNICNASPGSESSVVLSVHEAQINIASRRGTRRVAYDDFTTGVNRTCLEPDEVVVSIFIPSAPRALGIYRRITRTAGMDLACWNGAALVFSPNTPAKREIRFAFGTVMSTTYRPRAIEAKLSRRPLTPADMDAAYEAICAEIQPRASSLRASPDEKRRAIRNFLDELLALLTPAPARRQPTA
ncbi:MAG: FAD binding domain-containing protein [Kiritimatiellia bacterium]